MRQLVEAVRSTGATQIVAVQAFSDAHGFEGLGPEYWLSDANVIYEVHPYFDLAMTTAERDNKFGFLANQRPVYAGEWGLTLQEDTERCRRLPRDTKAASELVYQLLTYLFNKRISWTASSFEPGSLIADYESYANTRLDLLWQCGEQANPQPGMGELVLLWLTGDPTGFGELLPEAITNAATYRAGPVAPGENIAIYGVEIGPYPGVDGLLDESGKLPTSVGEVQVLFDGVPAPIFSASAYQINAQVPYSIAERQSTSMQIVYNGVPSRRVAVAVVEASPGIYADFIDRAARALNQDGSVNTAAAPARAGTVVTLFATGAGLLSPARTGRAAVEPLGTPGLPVSIRIGGSAAEVLYAGEAAGFVGLVQLNARVPALAASTNGRSVTREVVLSVGLLHECLSCNDLG